MQTAFATGFLTEFIFIFEKSRYDIFFFKRGRGVRVYVKKVSRVSAKPAHGLQ